MSGHERGLTVIEVVVSLTLLAVVFGSVTTLISRTVAGLGAATDRDAAGQLATSMLEEAKAFGCGLATGADSAAVTARWRTQCWGGLGDSTMTTQVGSTTFTATLHTAWKQVNAGPQHCVDPDASHRRSKPLRAEADGLERQVIVSWRAGHIDTDGYETVPPDAVAYRDTSRGAVLLSGRAGATASVSTGGGPPVIRAIDASGCSLFPFLPSGPANWSIDGTTGSATVVSEQIISEPDGSVIS